MSGTKMVLLRNTGHYAVVDEEDFQKVDQLSPWYENDQGYAVKKTKIKGKNLSIRMHALVNNTPKGLVTDHINGDKLDNRKENLRSVGQMINSWNSKNIGREHTVYNLPKGVSYDKSRNKYVSTKTIRRRFGTLEEAIKFNKESEGLDYERDS